jgi:hypothetical protein
MAIRNVLASQLRGKGAIAHVGFRVGFGATAIVRVDRGKHSRRRPKLMLVPEVSR